MRILFFLLFGFSAFAQVTTEEIFPTGDKEITLIFDLKLAKDSRASGLLGKTSDVFLWSGAGDADAGDAFKYQPAGQTIAANIRGSAAIRRNLTRSASEFPARNRAIARLIGICRLKFSAPAVNCYNWLEPRPALWDIQSLP